jgi:hypothetical protein
VFTAPASHRLRQAVRDLWWTEWHWDMFFFEYFRSLLVLFSPCGITDGQSCTGTSFSLNILDFPCQYPSLSVHVRPVMDKVALELVFLRVFWLSAVTVHLRFVVNWEALWQTFLHVLRFTLSLSFAPCEISGGRIGAGTCFYLSVSFHQFPMPIFFFMITLPEGQMSESWDL